jgi:hypothetical protein
MENMSFTYISEPEDDEIMSTGLDDCVSLSDIEMSISSEPITSKHPPVNQLIFRIFKNQVMQCKDPKLQVTGIEKSALKALEKAAERQLSSVMNGISTSVLEHCALLTVSSCIFCCPRSWP